MKYMKKGIAFLLATALMLFSASATLISISAAEAVVEIVESTGKSYGTYGSITVAHNAASKAKLEGYTLRLLQDIVTDSKIELQTKVKTNWTLDGNGKKITCTTSSETALWILGSSDAIVTIKDLTIDSRGTAIRLEAGTFNILSGTYTCRDSANWVDAALWVQPMNESKVIVHVWGGNFYGIYTGAEALNTAGKHQAAVRSFNSDPLGMNNLNIYGGYFYSSNNNTAKGNDNVIYTGCDGGSAITRIYSGTFQADNAKFVATVDYRAKMEVYGGNFLGTVYNSDGVTGNTNGLLNVNNANSVGWFYSANMFSGGVMFRVKGTGTFEPETYYSFTGVRPELPDFYRQYWGYTPEGTSKSVNFIPTMQTGASLLMTADKAGIRYTTKVAASTIEELLNEVADEGTELSYGTIITGAKMEGTDLPTRDLLEAKGYDFVDVKANADNVKIDADGNVTFTGALVNIGEDYYSTDFTAISYIEVIVNGVKVRYYNLYDGFTRSLTELATAALADVKGVSDTDYPHAVGNGTYSRYSETQRVAMARFLSN